jgi:hypothetical protein
MRLKKIKTKLALAARHLLKLPLLSGLLLLGSGAWAAPEEIQVYMDEMGDKGEFGLDVHLNYVPEGIKLADYPGGQAPHRVFRVTPEFSYGLTPNLELGLYVLTSRDADGHSTVDGQKLRLKYIAPKAADQAYFIGANLEVGRVDFRLNENPWNGELKGIFGYRKDRWTLALNTNIGFKIAGPADSPPTLSLATKVAYKTDRDFQIGFESYNELGELGRLGSLNLGQLSQTLYAVIDATVGGWDINFGLGRGWTSDSDRWVIKAVVSVPFGN